MENVNDSKKFLSDILDEIKRIDPVHAKTLRKRPDYGDSDFFNYLRNTIYRNFYILKIGARTVAEDYLHMVRDMRREMVYFHEHEKYSCKSEKEAYERVYSRPEVMSYYLNALMISQILWYHHYAMLEEFFADVENYIPKENAVILDIGAGFGIHSMIIRDTVPEYKKIDFYDISETSLDILRKIHGIDRIEYHTTIPDKEYDLIILGEVLEHTENPLRMLRGLIPYLKPNGIMFITVPTNAPAIDHIYLFRGEEEVFDLVQRAGLYDIGNLISEADDKTAIVGLYCVKK